MGLLGQSLLVLAYFFRMLSHFPSRHLGHEAVPLRLAARGER